MLILGVFLILIDQEDKSLEDVWSGFDIKIKEYLECQIRGAYQDRLRFFDCQHGDKSFNLIITINGISRYANYVKHTIEDHLIEMAKDVLGQDRVMNVLRESSNDPKIAWFKLSKREQLEVYKKMLNESIDSLRRYFEQHIKSIELLEEI